MAEQRARTAAVVSQSQANNLVSNSAHIDSFEGKQALHQSPYVRGPQYANSTSKEAQVLSNYNANTTNTGGSGKAVHFKVDRGQSSALSAIVGSQPPPPANMQTPLIIQNQLSGVVDHSSTGIGEQSREHTPSGLGCYVPGAVVGQQSGVPLSPNFVNSSYTQQHPHMHNVVIKQDSNQNTLKVTKARSSKHGGLQDQQIPQLQQPLSDKRSYSTAPGTAVTRGQPHLAQNNPTVGSSQIPTPQPISMPNQNGNLNSTQQLQQQTQNPQQQTPAQKPQPTQPIPHKQPAIPSLKLQQAQMINALVNQPLSKTKKQLFTSHGPPSTNLFRRTSNIYAANSAMTPSLRGPVMPPMTAQIFATNFEDFSPNKQNTGHGYGQTTQQNLALNHNLTTGQYYQRGVKSNVLPSDFQSWCVYQGVNQNEVDFKMPLGVKGHHKNNLPAQYNRKRVVFSDVSEMRATVAPGTLINYQQKLGIQNNIQHGLYNKQNQNQNTLNLGNGYHIGSTYVPEYREDKFSDWVSKMANS